MMLSAGKIIAVLALLILFLYGSSWIARSTQINAELMRKFVHSGLGLTCAAFPWVFSSTGELMILCAGVMFVLLLTRYHPTYKEKLGMGLHCVKRKSVGDLLFGITVVLLFHYSHGEHARYALYVLPLLILTLSDSAAALVGTRYGKHIFHIIGGQKSWEGCLAFFVVTFILSVLTLSWLSDLTLLHILLISAILATIGSMVEAVSWHGWDNLFVPLGLFLLLQSLIEKPVSMLLFALAVLVLIVFSARKLNQYSQLNMHALLGALLAAYFFLETGGWQWLLPPLIVFAVHIMLSCLQDNAKHKGYQIDAVISIVATGIFWLFLSKESSFNYAYYLFVLSMAIHVQIMMLLRIRAQRGHTAEYALIILIALLSGWIFLPTLLVQYAVTQAHVVICSTGFLIMALGGIFLQVNTDKTTSLNRWVAQGLYAAVGSVIGLIPILFYTL